MITIDLFQAGDRVYHTRLGTFGVVKSVSGYGSCPGPLVYNVAVGDVLELWSHANTRFATDKLEGNVKLLKSIKQVVTEARLLYHDEIGALISYLDKSS